MYQQPHLRRLLVRITSIIAAVVVALFTASPALADPCRLGVTEATTQCSRAQIAAMDPKWWPQWYRERAATPSADEQYQADVRAEDLRERAVAFDAGVANEMADEQATREGKARKSYFVQSLVGAIVAPLAQAGADRLSGYGGRWYYGSGSYGRGGGFYSGNGNGSVDPGRRTQPVRVHCNPGAGQYCP